MSKTCRQTIAHISYAGQGASGPTGLILAVMSQAVVDYVVGDEREASSAAAYFTSSLYQHHLQWLGLPGDYMPELVEGAINATAENGG